MNTLLQNLLEKFNNGEAENIGAKRIFEHFNAKQQFEKDAVRSCLNTLENQGKIVYLNGRYMLFEHSPFLKGKIKGNERGFAFLITDSGDYFVPPKALHGALNGDEVIALKLNDKKGLGDEVEVYKIINRGVKKLVGLYESENGFGFVIPDDRAFSTDIYVSYKNSRGAKTGDKVYVEITGYPENRKNPEGKVLEILGKRFDKDTEELSIIKNASLPLEFPSNCVNEAEKLPDSLEKADYKNRKDFTNDLIITIDGDDSRDFDDAVSVVKNGDGTYTLGVHIADVSHYVKSNSSIDKEALNRSTSVYFPERVIPMLPEKLSNGICSLNEGVDRLTLSVIMQIDKNGEVISSNICEGVIRSKQRMTYKNVQKILDGDEETVKKYSKIVPLITVANELKVILSNKREKKGNIELSVKESHIFVNENGQIVIEPRQDNDAYKIIEEFMIVANETVAEYVYYMNLPFVYRVHEKPNEEKLNGFIAFLNALGILVKWKQETCHSKDFQTLLKSVEDKSVYGVINKVMLRSMQKAKYSPENIGHFGLSSKCYCHFTSPIRRYPDLVVHRIIKSILHGKDTESMFAEFVNTASLISSENEKRADEVERTMDDFYKCRYMRSHIGEEYEGIISGVTNFGLFVELENTVEGLVRVEKLAGHSYKFDEKRFTLYNNFNSYSLGEKVLIKVLGVDSVSRKIDFALIEEKTV